MVMGDKEVIKQDLVFKGGDRGAYKLLGDIMVMLERCLANLGASISVMPYSTYTTLGLGDLIPTKLIVELADRTVKRPKGIAENVLVGINKFTFLVDFIILDIPEDFKTPLILGRPFLSTAHAIINVFKAKITLSVGNDKIFFKSNKPASNIIKRNYALSLIRSTELDLEARLMGNALRKNRSHDPKFEDFLELNGEGIDTPIKEMVKTRHDDDDMITNGIEDYPSFSDLDRKIHVNGACNLRLEFTGKSIVGAFMNAPIFVGTFSVMIDFAVIKDMDNYRDEEMGDVIVGKEFCKEIRVKAKRIEGMTTIYNGDDEVQACTNNINTVNPEVSTATTKVNTASTEICTVSFSDATLYAFISTQPKVSQLVHKDLEQLHDDDLEEIDLKVGI
ncbi:uncharacterized mitochondrial protein-like protein [Tanacetum coccineum]